MVPNPWMGILFFCLFCTSSFVCFDVEVPDTNLGRKTYRLKFFVYLSGFQCKRSFDLSFLISAAINPLAHGGCAWASTSDEIGLATAALCDG